MGCSMGIAEKIYQYSLGLPEEQARQLLSYAQFLQQQATHIQSGTKRQSGLAKDTITIIDKDWYKPDSGIENDFYQ